MANQNPALYKLVKQFLDKREWKYGEVPDDDLIHMNMNLQCALTSVAVFMSMQEDGFQVLAYTQLKVRPDRRDQMCKLMSLLNFKLREGKFTMNPDDGEVRYESFLYCPDALPSPEVVKHTVELPIWMLRRYGDAVALVALTQTTPEAALVSKSGE